MPPRILEDDHKSTPSKEGLGAIEIRGSTRRSASRGAPFAVEDVDQAIALLTGMPAGDADEKGHFPEGTVNRRVSARLAELTKLRASFAHPRRKKPSGKKRRKKEE